jgi:Cdc6-like AAA superfamily ATPase|tara:strand:+ start:636 stop:1130 length:495 start_codon:yes stop_codon:yes gene_type:complete
MALKSKLGSLLMDADIITKRQLNDAIAKQSNGDDRKLGEILVAAGYVTVEDLTEVMLGEAQEAQSEREKSKRDRLLQKQILQKKIVPKPVVPKAIPITAKPSVSDDEILKKKFTLSIQTMVAAITGLVSLIGMWYALQADIQANVFKIDTLGKEIDRLRDGENN